jgi:long-chain acyl-CoA synthetase
VAPALLAREALMGEDVVAFVVAKAGAALGPESVIAFCQERLARYKCPKDVRLLDALPKSSVGKILRKELRARPE